MEVIRWTHLLFPRSYMRDGLLVATASFLPGRALSAYTKEHVIGPYAMVWLNTEGRCSSLQMSHGGSVSLFRQLPAARKALTPISIAPGIRCMTWNASKALVYDELLIWASTQPFEVLAIQETGWRFSATWSTSEWHCTHSACKQASVLLMVRVHLAPADRLATATLIEGRLLHVRIFLKRTIDFLIVY